jgi:exosome complex RNA-binding protein Rrp42 (RNase PH superfamily)
MREFELLLSFFRSGCRSLKMFGRHRRQYTKQIARSLNYILNNPKCFDLTQLCVVKGHHCWLVHVDISVGSFSSSRNLIYDFLF